MRVFILLCLLCSSIAAWADDSPPVVRVNDVPISQFRLERYLPTTSRLRGGH